MSPHLLNTRLLLENRDAVLERSGLGLRPHSITRKTRNHGQYYASVGGEAPPLDSSKRSRRGGTNQSIGAVQFTEAEAREIYKRNRNLLKMFKAARENDFALVNQNIAQVKSVRREGLREAV